MGQLEDSNLKVHLLTTYLPTYVLKLLRQRLGTLMRT